MIQIEIVSQQNLLQPDLEQMTHSVQQVFESHGRNSGELSVILLDNEAIHQANRQHLKHDYPTDVITFDLSDPEDPDHSIDGEILISAEYAQEMAGNAGWPAEHELLLYLVHGALHLCGFDDLTDEDRVVMRQQERLAFQLLQLPEPPIIDSACFE